MWETLTRWYFKSRYGLVYTEKEKVVGVLSGLAMLLGIAGITIGLVFMDIDTVLAWQVAMFSLWLAYAGAYGDHRLVKRGLERRIEEIMSGKDIYKARGGAK